MNQLARYLSSIPGRKNLIWFSGSFPISILPDTTGNLPDPFAVVADYEKEFRDTVNLLARSQVAVYPVDARGLTNAPVFDAATTPQLRRRNRPARMTQDLNKFSNDTAAEHSTMSQMAEATGGHAFYNTNGLTQAVATAINDGSNFYTLTYTPANPNRDGKFRKIKVQLARQGVNLAYRHGYYADDPDKGPSRHQRSAAATKVADSAVTAAAPSPLQTMRVAMMRGSPTPTEIIMKVAVFPVGPSTQTEDNPAPGNILSEKTHGPFRRYSVSYAIESRRHHVSPRPRRQNPRRLRTRHLRLQSRRRPRQPAQHPAPHSLAPRRTQEKCRAGNPIQPGDQRSRQRRILSPHRGPRPHPRPPRSRGGRHLRSKKPAASDRSAPPPLRLPPLRNAGKQLSCPSIVPAVQ